MLYILWVNYDLVWIDGVKIKIIIIIILSIYPVVMLTVVWRYKYTAVLLSVQTVLKCKGNVNNINVELQIVYL